MHTGPAAERGRSEHLHCRWLQPDPGLFHTPIVGCDPTPTVSDERFETRASILGQVVDRTGSPITGATFSVYDDRHVGAREAMWSHRVGADGKASRPASPPSGVRARAICRSSPVLVVDAPASCPQNASPMPDLAMPSRSVPFASSRAIPRSRTSGRRAAMASDSEQSSSRDSAGRAHDDGTYSDNAFSPARGLPCALPSSTLTIRDGAGVHGDALRCARDRRIANTLSLPTNVLIPVGFYNPRRGTGTRSAKPPGTGHALPSNDPLHRDRR